MIESEKVVVFQSSEGKLISLTHGKFAIVDEQDFERVNQFKWHCTNQGRAARGIKKVNPLTGKRYCSIQFMSRFITDEPAGLEVDHINRNRLDNRRCNLRVVTRSQNAKNRGCYANSKSGVKGVMWFKKLSKWIVQIRVNGKKRHIGLYHDIEEARQAYAKASRQFHGDFGGVN